MVKSEGNTDTVLSPYVASLLLFLDDYYSKVKDALSNFVKAKNDLKNLDVLKSERLTSEFGEWFSEKLTGAMRARMGSY